MTKLVIIHEELALSAIEALLMQAHDIAGHSQAPCLIRANETPQYDDAMAIRQAVEEPSLHSGTAEAYRAGRRDALAQVTEILERLSAD